MIWQLDSGRQFAAIWTAHWQRQFVMLLEDRKAPWRSPRLAAGFRQSGQWLV